MNTPYQHTSGGSDSHRFVADAIQCVAACVFAFFVCTPTLDAQPRSAWNWYFGQNAGLTFSNGTAQPLADGRMVTNEGCASISDPTTGELLFYTDGVTVFNRIHEPMPNGTGLFGDFSTSQSAIIIPAPGRPQVYYIFNPAAVTAANLGNRCLCLYYSVVDMRADAGFGDVVKKNELVASDITEHLTATVDCSGEGWWVVVRSRSTRHFFSFHLTRDQLRTEPVVSDAGFPVISIREAGQMHISPDGRKLVITSTGGNSLLYNFDNQTGKVTDGTDLFPFATFGSHYGASFAPGSKKVYVCVANETPLAPTRVYQFSIEGRDGLSIAASRYQIATLRDIYTWVPMQLAPDGRVYIARTGQTWLSAITDPDADTSEAHFRDSVVQIQGACRFGLPNFPGSVFIEPGSRQLSCSLPRADMRHRSETCERTCVQFTDASSGSVDSWKWEFVGATPPASFERSPRSVCYARAGTYNVRLIATNSYGSDTVVSSITVLPRPQVTVDSVAEVCVGDMVTLTATGADSYSWLDPSVIGNPASSTVVVRPSSTTRYTVVGMNSYGCADTASVLVRVVTMRAGLDQTICKGASVTLEATGADEYEWSPTTGLSDPRSSQPVATPLSTTNYVVTMRKGLCVTIDTVAVTVVDSFRVSIQGPVVGCEGDTVVLEAVGGTSFTWLGMGVIDATTRTCRVRVGNNPATIVLLATTGTCVDVDSVVVSPHPVTPLELRGSNRVCKGESVALEAVTDAEFVEWTPATGLNTTTGKFVICTPTETTTYTAYARSANGCNTLSSIVVTVDALPALNPGPDRYICPGSAVELTSADGLDRVEWTPEEGLNDARSARPLASPLATTTYVVRGWKGRCEAVDTVTVVVSSVQLQVSSDTTICAGGAVRLYATGAAQYEWSPTTGLSDPTSSTTIASPTVTTTYVVRGTDPQGCVDTASITVIVVDTLPIRLYAGSVTARAGTDNVGIPIIIDVPQSLLPLRLSNLRATLVHNASVFLPDSTDRGALRTSVRGSDRLSYLLFDDMLILTPRQKVTEVRGLVLASGIEVARLLWEDVQWDADVCPSITTTPGMLYISGCNISGRMLKSFTAPTVTVTERRTSNTIDVDIEGGIPGYCTVELTAVDGRTVLLTQSVRDNGLTSVSLDGSSLGAGLYSLRVRTPQNTFVASFVWYR